MKERLKCASDSINSTMEQGAEHIVCVYIVRCQCLNVSDRKRMFRSAVWSIVCCGVRILQRVHGYFKCMVLLKLETLFLLMWCVVFSLLNRNDETYELALDIFRHFAEICVKSELFNRVHFSCFWNASTSAFLLPHSFNQQQNALNHNAPRSPHANHRIVSLLNVLLGHRKLSVTVLRENEQRGVVAMMVTSLLKMAKDFSERSHCISALQCLVSICGSLTSPHVASLLPGVSSSLFKQIMGDFKQGSKLISMSIEVIFELFSFFFSIFFSGLV